MSAPNNTQPADLLLRDAVKSIGVIIPPHVDDPTTAILIAAHALITRLDAMETALLGVLRNSKAGS